MTITTTSQGLPRATVRKDHHEFARGIVVFLLRRATAEELFEDELTPLVGEVSSVQAPDSWMTGQLREHLQSWGLEGSLESRFPEKEGLYRAELALWEDGVGDPDYYQVGHNWGDPVPEYPPVCEICGERPADYGPVHIKHTGETRTTCRMCADRWAGYTD